MTYSCDMRNGRKDRGLYIYLYLFFYSFLFGFMFSFHEFGIGWLNGVILLIGIRNLFSEASGRRRLSFCYSDDM
jgi:hypothetical protein